MEDIDFQIIVAGANIRPPKGSFGYSTCCLLKDQNFNILCDTGSFGVREDIKKMLNKVDALFISHLHFDHCSNIDLFFDVPVYVSEKEVESLYLSDDYNVYTPLKFFIDRCNIIFLENSKNISNNTVVYPTPGHTKGHHSIGFKSNNKKYIFAGDSIKTRSEYLYDKCCVTPIDEKKHRLSKKFIINNFDVIIPGHQDILYKENLIENKIILTTF